MSEPLIFIVPTTLGPRQCRVFRQEGGLAVTSDPLDTFFFNVTHLASGRTAAAAFTSQEEASAGLDALLPLGDWTRSWWELRDDKPFVEEVRRVRAELEPGEREHGH